MTRSTDGTAKAAGALLMRHDKENSRGSLPSCQNDHCAIWAQNIVRLVNMLFFIISDTSPDVYKAWSSAVSIATVGAFFFSLSRSKGSFARSA